MRGTDDASLVAGVLCVKDPAAVVTTIGPQTKAPPQTTALFQIAKLSQ